MKKIFVEPRARVYETNVVSIIATSLTGQNTGTVDINGSSVSEESGAFELAVRDNNAIEENSIWDNAW